MIKSQWRKFVECHTGVLNKVIHGIGFSLIGLGTVGVCLSFADYHYLVCSALEKSIQ
ncbi:MAG: hypothetical protein UW70_C0045G0009 [Candidatus Peregrinibacteria bacterium GW2011_GWA2_44_7]|nr:MAG: hypothetical protein UW70_C0045G0009 [Candidatus Peregrinibacteria bacterium GW2011_GWA2_44_7]